MPVKVTKYRCGFKCGKHAMNDVKAAERHERGCFKNPENKTCATCKNEIYNTEYEDDDFGSNKYHGRDCKIEVMSNFIESIHDDLKVEPSGHIKPLFNCPCHNQDAAPENINEYIELIGKRIADFKKAKENAEGLPF